MMETFSGERGIPFEDGTRVKDGTREDEIDGMLLTPSMVLVIVVDDVVGVVVASLFVTILGVRRFGVVRKDSESLRSM